MKTINDNNDAKRGHTRVQWMFALLANSCLMLYGLEAGWMSPMTKVLQSEQSPVGAPLTDNTISLIASVMCVAASMSVPLFSYIADAYGRKPAVIIIALQEAISWIIKLSWPSTTGLLIARACGGMAAGGCYGIVPLYVKEISQDDIRGLLGSLLVMAQNLGILVMYVIGEYFEYHTVLWIVFLLPLVTVALMFKAPESPAFVVKTGNLNEAARIVAYLRGLNVDDKIVQNELEAMKNQEAYFRTLPEVSLLSIFKNPTWRYAVILTLAMISVHAANGAFAVINFGSSTLASSGVEFSISPALQSLSFPIVMIFGSLLSMGCVERYGRKPLLTGTLILSVCSFGCLATTILLHSKGVSTPSALPVLAMVGTVFAYAAGVSPLPFIIMSEMFNFQIRAKVMGIAVTYSWFLTFLTLILYAPISSALGQHTTFFGFAGINLIGVFIILFFMPETKGKSDEQIEKELRKK